MRSHIYLHRDIPHRRFLPLTVTSTKLSGPAFVKRKESVSDRSHFFYLSKIPHTAELPISIVSRHFLSLLWNLVRPYLRAISLFLRYSASAPGMPHFVDEGGAGSSGAGVWRRSSGRQRYSEHHYCSGYGRWRKVLFIATRGSCIPCVAHCLGEGRPPLFRRGLAICSQIRAELFRSGGGNLVFSGGWRLSVVREFRRSFSSSLWARGGCFVFSFLET